jgi:signal transduction histidine kinase
MRRRAGAGPRRPLGLRARLIGALVVTSAVTLGAVAVALLSPLQQRLRNDRLDTLAADVLAIRPSFAKLGPDELRPGSKELKAVVTSLHRRTSADVAVLDSQGRPLAATDVDTGPFSQLVGALDRRDSVRKIVSSGGETEAEVAVRVTADGRRYVLAASTSLANVDAAVRSVVRAFVIAAILGALTALLLGVGLAARLSKRLEALREAALKVAELGPHVEMASDPGRDEVGDLSRAFATMQEKLNAQEQARRRFIATASHELRTPLTSLNLMLDLLKEDVKEGRVDAAETVDQIDRSQRQAARIAKLAAELLDLSRIDAGVPLDEEPLELAQLVRSVVAEFAPGEAADAAHIRFDAPDECWALGDSGSVARIGRILIDNARRFSPSSVRVTVSCEAGRPTVTVADSGPGVAAEERELIFERFSRGSEPAGDGGFGLGLAIARELAERMGGEVRLDDTSEGASFSLVLRAAPDEPVA